MKIKHKNLRLLYLQTKKLTLASLTVEMTLLIPFILLVIFLILSFAFYTHQKVFFTAAAYEAALTPGNEEHKANLAIEEAVLTIDTPELTVKNTLQNIKITYHGTIFPLFGSYSLPYTVEAQLERMDPVTYLRFVKFLQ